MYASTHIFAHDETIHALRETTERWAGDRLAPRAHGIDRDGAVPLGR